MWFCLLGLSVFLFGVLLHKFPHHISLDSRGSPFLVTFVFYGYFFVLKMSFGAFVVPVCDIYLGITYFSLMVFSTLFMHVAPKLFS